MSHRVEAWVLVAVVAVLLVTLHRLFGSSGTRPAPLEEAAAR